MTGRAVRLVVIGDALLDRDLTGAVDRIAPDAPVPVLAEESTVERPGGAGLAALLAARDGYDVCLITALASDVDGDRLRALLGEVEVRAAGLHGGTPVKTRVRAARQSLLRIDRGGRPVVDEVPAAALAEIARADGVLVSDYGRGMAGRPEVRAALAAAAARVPVVWDPHPRGAVPVPGTRLVTPNVAEAAQLAGHPPHPANGSAPARTGNGSGPARAARNGEPDGNGGLPRGAGPAISGWPGNGNGSGLAWISRLAAGLVERWQVGAVAVTMGRSGALLRAGDQPPLVIPASTVDTGAVYDTCGAGDRFAATAAGLLASQWLPSEAAVGAVRAATEFVLAGAAGALTGPTRLTGPTAPPGSGGPTRPTRPTGPAGPGGPGGPAARASVVEQVRARGGTIVATGGCFDLLHAGHVELLRAARALGDCLVVLLNSDDSVRRLKGPDRPLVPQADRARLLEALEPVDATVIFDEDTPAAALATVRPDIWAKGGDYAGMPLPEAATLAGWGGQVVLLPYHEGRSSTALIDACRAIIPTQERSRP
ncbi:MAG: D-beta-D-heptose 7-phosphate kinase / D-beta-D-heptose 1-phosphate adenosyltransferase [Mycobacteriales bacterium]